MQHMEQSMGVQSFFVMDENFLLNRPRALQLLKLMQEHNKSWALYVFSSINAIRKYSMEELVQLGISWIWVGLESPKSSYAKLKDSDTRAIVADLRSHGIKLLGSTIVGLEHHTPENIHEDIDYAVSHGTDFHQFMLYTPVPGTPLYHQMKAEGRMLEDVELADIHGQFKFNFQHAAISRDHSQKFLDGAFRHDFEQNGPSLFRICQTLFNGWKRYQRPSRAAHSRALRARGRQTPHHLQRIPVGDGEAAEGTAILECRRESGSYVRRSKRPLACRPDRCADTRTGFTVDLEARRPATGERRHLRAADLRRAPQLGGRIARRREVEPCRHRPAWLQAVTGKHRRPCSHSRRGHANGYQRLGGSARL